jgi:hypothetical protein
MGPRVNNFKSFQAASGTARRLLLSAMVLAGFACTLPGAAQEKTKTVVQAISLNSLSMEVSALQALHQLDLSREQLQKLQQLAAGAAQTEPKRQPAKVGPEVRDKLLALRAALVDGKDAERVDKLNDELDALREKEKPTFDDRVEMSQMAGKRAAEVFRLLKADQLAAYIGHIAEEIADPAERLIDDLEDVREMSEDEWKARQGELAEDIAYAVVGPDPAKSKPMIVQVSALLARARSLSKADFQKLQPELNKAVRKVIGEVSALEVVRHHVEMDLAVLLSNPRLEPALRARLGALNK